MNLHTIKPQDWPYTAEVWGELASMRQKPSAVPCSGCTACCKHDSVYLDPRRDDLQGLKWHTEFVSTPQGEPIPVAVLDRKEDGSCHYLTATGCGIHDKAPSICKRMDCRVLLLMTSPEQRAQRMRENVHMVHVYQAGLERLAGH